MKFIYQIFFLKTENDLFSPICSPNYCWSYICSKIFLKFIYQKKNIENVMISPPYVPQITVRVIFCSKNFFFGTPNVFFFLFVGWKRPKNWWCTMRCRKRSNCTLTWTPWRCSPMMAGGRAPCACRTAVWPAEWRQLR